MWPWEHIAFAYVLVSGVTRVLWGRPPSDRAVVALVVAALLPDLVDKPLAWGFDVLPSGRSLAHSLVVAVPAAVVALGVGIQRNDVATAVAFGTAYFSHLAGDVLYPLVTDGALRVTFLLWPLVPADPGDAQNIGHVFDLVAAYGEFLASPQGLAYLALEAVALALAALLWAVDGAPGRWWRADRRNQ